MRKTRTWPYLIPPSIRWSSTRSKENHFGVTTRNVPLEAPQVYTHGHTGIDTRGSFHPATLATQTSWDNEQEEARQWKGPNEAKRKMNKIIRVIGVEAQEQICSGLESSEGNLETFSDKSWRQWTLEHMTLGSRIPSLAAGSLKSGNSHSKSESSRYMLRGFATLRFRDICRWLDAVLWYFKGSWDWTMILGLIYADHAQSRRDYRSQSVAGPDRIDFQARTSKRTATHERAADFAFHSRCFYATHHLPFSPFAAPPSASFYTIHDVSFLFCSPRPPESRFFRPLFSASPVPMRFFRPVLSSLFFFLFFFILFPFFSHFYFYFLPAQRVHHANRTVHGVCPFSLFFTSTRLFYFLPLIAFYLFASSSKSSLRRRVEFLFISICFITGRD